MHGLKEIAVAQILRVNLTEMNLSVQSLFNPGCNLRRAQIQTFFFNLKESISKISPSIPFFI